MVNEKLWINKIQEFCELANVNTKSTGPTAAAIYRKIEFNFTDDDMIRAVDEMIDNETKLTWPISRRYFEKFRSIRIDAEAQRSRMREKNDVEALMSHAEIKELIDSIINKKPGTVQEPYLKANATIWRKNGPPLSVWIDPDDPNLEPGKAVTIVYEQCGENMVRTQHIRLSMVRHKILSPRVDGPPAGKQQGGLSLVPPPPDDADDFIPELEVPENAFQGTLNMDGRPGGHA